MLHASSADSFASGVEQTVGRRQTVFIAEAAKKGAPSCNTKKVSDDGEQRRTPERACGRQTLMRPSAGGGPACNFAKEFGADKIAAIEDHQINQRTDWWWPSGASHWMIFT
jgi:hypothetical protein